MKERKVYVVNSTVQDEFLIFGSYKRAENWINNYYKDIFDKSSKDDLYISKRIVF